MIITKKQARKFILMKQGLYGPYRFSGREGILDFIRQAGCIQFDPIDICGKNHELVLQSRVEGFRKSWLYDLLYKERVLFDYYDKMMAIMPIEDWPYFDSTREHHRHHGRGIDDVNKAADRILKFIDNHGPVCSSDIEHDGTMIGYWGKPTKLSRVALETLYFRGELVIHHKKNTRKFYDLAHNHIPSELLNISNPNGTAEEQQAWHLKRRISSAGLLWNRRSDALLGIGNMKTPERNRTFEGLLALGVIRELHIEGISYPFYYLVEDSELMQNALEEDAPSNRLEFLAPLDNMMWDRLLIEELFDFKYKWEIYTPAKDRKFGYYVLPMLYGEKLAGRVEIKKNPSSGIYEIQNLWLEEKTRETKKLHHAINQRLKKFNKFNKS